ncbi:hypothetical protein [Coxiella endosymbiont of Ornithodoros maritimus]|uniref:hypothetical protein n=1 Tax=Coxiella endosymbiont of Ornithodoros maritimus TaxID=1656172 RepID=UPI002B3FFE3D|nr:hypothetical protein [Coxiella endosymbiont of Ornithodoros maritimus]
MMLDINDLLRIQIHDKRKLILEISRYLYPHLEKIIDKAQLFLILEEKDDYFYLRREKEINGLTLESLEWGLGISMFHGFIIYNIDNKKINLGWDEVSNPCYGQIIALSSNYCFREKLKRVFRWKPVPCYKQADLGLYGFSQKQDRWRTEDFTGPEQDKRVNVFVDIDNTLLDRLATYKTYNKRKTTLFANVINKLKGIKQRYPQTEFFIITARSEPSTPEEWKRGDEFSTFSVLKKLREEGIAIKRYKVIFTSYWGEGLDNGGGEVISKGGKINIIEKKLKEKELSVRPDFITFLKALTKN